ncbi:hypothetical protein [Nesterenkonia lutea]|uniref:Uncharacterized protein n=1 Tax=Nesterenkonia lutea TaxID=272919 RepID=A0ABR9JC90_9MICC|nr:hypothetical protein [Nesterenkonia lutea]MBE1523533.1 hypothetical protein [Nesterenkonia lutea]
MTAETIAILENDDGFLLLGPDEFLSFYDENSELNARRLKKQTLAGLGKALGASSGLQPTSGRWVKLTKESAEFAEKAGVVNPSAGVVRRSNGQILKHLKFEQAALLTPAAPAVLSALATQAALEVALDEIGEYLATMDAKLDQLLKQRKVEVLGQLGGVTLAIDEARILYAEVGTVSGIAWSKVQANSLALQTIQAEAVAQLDSLAESVKKQVGNTDKSAQALDSARDDAPFWLGVLARSIALQDRQYVIELARVAEDEPFHLEAHRQGIRMARADRTHKISRSLEAITASVRDSGELSNLDRVANPFSAQRVDRGANSVNQSVTHFAEHVDLELIEVNLLESVSWGIAARGLLGDAGSRAESARVNVANAARGLGSRLRDRREESLLAKANKIQEERQARLNGLKSDLTEGTPPDEPT